MLNLFSKSRPAESVHFLVRHTLKSFSLLSSSSVVAITRTIISNIHCLLFILFILCMTVRTDLFHSISSTLKSATTVNMNYTTAIRTRLLTRPCAIVNTTWSRSTIRSFHRGAKVPAITASEARRRPTNNTSCQTTASLPAKLPTTTRTIFIQTQPTPNQVSRTFFKDVY